MDRLQTSSRTSVGTVQGRCSVAGRHSMRTAPSGVGLDRGHDELVAARRACAPNSTRAPPGSYAHLPALAPPATLPPWARTRTPSRRSCAHLAVCSLPQSCSAHPPAVPGPPASCPSRCRAPTRSALDYSQQSVSCTCGVCDGIAGRRKVRALGEQAVNEPARRAARTPVCTR